MSYVSLYPSLIVYCPDKYITQGMCDVAVDDSLAALKLITDVNLNNINLDQNFGKDDPDTVILSKLLACHSKFKKHKTLKKVSEELIPLAWRHKR